MSAEGKPWTLGVQYRDSTRLRRIGRRGKGWCDCSGNRVERFCYPCDAEWVVRNALADAPDRALPMVELFGTVGETLINRRVPFAYASALWAPMVWSCLMRAPEFRLVRIYDRSRAVQALSVDDANEVLRIHPEFSILTLCDLMPRLSPEARRSLVT